MIYITGDTHGNFKRVAALCDTVNSTLDDILIILGDVGVNYYEDDRDVKQKKLLSSLPITLFCIHGNHEARPEYTGLYQTKSWHGGNVFVENEYPNILFAKDGELFDLGGFQTIAIGGAYSVDKFYRLARGWHWWSNEQPSTEIKQAVERKLGDLGNQIDVVLSHTCPLKYEPIEVFLGGIDQSTVDKTTEQWLDDIEDRLIYRKWYCGHYHTSKKIDKLEFLFEDIKAFMP
ncbi:hypothetical protein MASR2M70_17120 [Bacillota bacterium]